MVFSSGAAQTVHPEPRVVSIPDPFPSPEEWSAMSSMEQMYHLMVRWSGMTPGEQMEYLQKLSPETQLKLRQRRNGNNENNEIFPSPEEWSTMSSEEQMFHVMVKWRGMTQEARIEYLQKLSPETQRNQRGVANVEQARLQANLQPSAITFNMGDSVTVTGLQVMRQYNGKRGIVTGFQTCSGELKERFEDEDLCLVQFDHEDIVMAFQAANLNRGDLLPSAHLALEGGGDGAMERGWRAVLDPNGQTYYQNELTQATQWERPDGYEGMRGVEPGVDGAIERGWRAVLDPNGQTYYQNELTHATQWERPNGYEWMSGVEPATQVIDQRDFRQGTPMSTVDNRTYMYCNEEELEEHATDKDKVISLISLIFGLGQRLIFIVPAVVEDKQSGTIYIYLFDIFVAFYYGIKQRYCPGSMYNEIHVFFTGRKFKKMFFSKSGKFSGWKKLILGLGAVATIIQSMETISRIICFFDLKPGSPGYDKELSRAIYGGAGVLINLNKTLVALVASVVFLGFMIRFFVWCAWFRSDEPFYFGTDSRSFMFNLYALMWESLEFNFSDLADSS